MLLDRLDVYGVCFDGYCEPLAPSGLPHFYHPDGSVTFSRLPVYPEYQMVFDQANGETDGKELVAFAPIAQEILVHLSWPRMKKADKEAFVVFFRDIVDGTSKEWTYTNEQVMGPGFPVRFASAELPVMPEVAFEQYQVDVTLRGTRNFPQVESTGVAPVVDCSRFVIGGIWIQVPAPSRPGSGQGLTKFQTFARDSSGSPVIYCKSGIVRIPHCLEILHDYDTLVSFQVFFFWYTWGARKKFTWVDQDNVSRTVRLSGANITSRQLGYNRFQTTLNLIEELPA